MKVRLSLLITLIVIMVSTVLMIGCKYDVAPPLWNEPYTEPSSPTISQVDPAAATPGVNVITIRGEKFAGTLDSNLVYFGTLPAEIITVSSTAIAVRRPNLVSDTCTIKVVTENAFLEAKYGPYKIDRVMSKWGNFNDNFQLFMVAVDKSENVYVIDRQLISTAVTHNHLTKIAPNGDVTIDTLINGTTTADTIGNLKMDPVDGVIGPDGRLYLPGTGTTNFKKDITVVDLATKKWTVWRKVIGNKVLTFGDFDANGYFYVAGIKGTDLYVVMPDSSSVATTLYTGADTEILTLRVFKNYLYVAANLNSGEKGIWRHPLTGSGTLGPKELYLDWTKVDTTIAKRTIKNMAMSSDDIMYIGTASTDPLLVVLDPAANKVDYFYKNILLPYDNHIVWGNGNFLYYISGNSTPAQEWKLYRVDLGTTGAPKN
jgi:hypothetical protein